MGRSGCLTKREKCGEGGLLASPKFCSFPFCFILSPTKKFSTHVPLSTYEVSLIAFRQILSATCIFRYTIMTYLKKLDGTKLSVQQDYLPELYPRHPHSYQKCPLLWCCLIAPTSRGCWLSTLSLEPLWETLRMEQNATQLPKIYSFLQPESP